MQRHSHKNGFTLIELLVVLVLVIVVGRFALIVSFDRYRRASYHVDRAYLIAALERARSLALNDVCEGGSCAGGVSHGVSIRPDSYVIFQGASYATRDPSFDEVVEANSTIVRSGLSEIVFAPESGDVSQSGAIVLVDSSGRTSTTTIGSYGQISWTH